MAKIFNGWNSQHWQKPLLKEVQVPSEQTVLELHTLSLISEEVLTDLRNVLGERTFNTLTDDERLILVTASIEKTVNHARMMLLLSLHPRDLSALLAQLVQKRLLHKEGNGRGTLYFLGVERERDLWNESIENLAGEFPPVNLHAQSAGSSDSLGNSSGTSGDNSGTSGDNSGTSEDSSGTSEDSSDISELLIISKVISEKQRSPREDVERVILTLCSIEALSLDQLTELLNRSEALLRKKYLRSLIQSRKLRYKYPTSPQHPRQAYITIGSEIDTE